MTMVEPKEIIQTRLLQSHNSPIDPTMIHFLKERQIEEWLVYAVMFTDATDQEWHFVFGLTHDDKGAWEITAGGGGSGIITQRTDPWANLVGNWSAHGFCAGGFVFAGDQNINRVRLVCPNNIFLEDTVDDGIVLFATATQIDAAKPITVELYDSTGALVRSHPLS